MALLTSEPHRYPRNPTTPRDSYRVGALVSAAAGVAPDKLNEFEAQIFDGRGVGDCPAGALRRRAERIAARVDPTSVAERVDQGRRRCSVDVVPGDWPGTTSWTAIAPTARSTQAWAAICELAEQYLRARPGTDRGQARSEAFLDLLLGETQVSTVVTVSMVGTDAAAAIDGRVEITAGEFVDVGTCGSLPSADVVALLADPDTRVRLARLDPMTGATAFLANRSYRPGAELARLVRARDGTCRFPGCGMPADRCDIDHAIPFPHGPTDVRNLHCLCRRHHGFKHHAGWAVDLAWDGTLIWTAPTGRQHVTYPADRRESVVRPSTFLPNTGLANTGLSNTGLANHGGPNDRPSWEGRPTRHCRDKSRSRSGDA